jgi:hypothetical protein
MLYINKFASITHGLSSHCNAFYKVHFSNLFILNNFGELVIEGVDIVYLWIFRVLKILQFSFPTRQDGMYFFRFLFEHMLLLFCKFVVNLRKTPNHISSLTNVELNSNKFH